MKGKYISSHVLPEIELTAEQVLEVWAMKTATVGTRSYMPITAFSFQRIINYSPVLTLVVLFYEGICRKLKRSISASFHALLWTNSFITGSDLLRAQQRRQSETAKLSPHSKEVQLVKTL